MQDNHLFVTSKQEFKTMIRVAEAMSYKYDQFFVSGHGKQIQRATEVVANMLRRGWAEVETQEFGQAGEERKYPTLKWVLKKV